MYKVLIGAIAVLGTTEAAKVQVNTLNQVISELDMLEKHKLNSNLEVELLDFLQQEMKEGSLNQMKEKNQSLLLGDTVMWLKKRFTNQPY